MTHQELELWTQEIISNVLRNERIEDSKIELKSAWPEPNKGSHALAAHANAARGMTILWLIGVDEKAQRLTNANPVELANWSKSISRFFDGEAPRMALDANVRREDKTVVAMYFETHQGAPFVVKNPTGGYPEFTVPWREGTSKRAAKRDELLRILVPIRRVSALVDELDFNLAVTQATIKIASLGALFREDEFHQALRDAVMSTLPSPLRTSITDAYVSMKRANHLITTALGVSLQHRQPDQLAEAWNAVKDCRPLIVKASEGLSRL